MTELFFVVVVQRSAPASPSQLQLAAAGMTSDEFAHDDSSLQETLTYQVVETSASGDGMHMASSQPQILQRVAQLASQDIRFSQSAPGSPAGIFALFLCFY